MRPLFLLLSLLLAGPLAVCVGQATHDPLIGTVTNPDGEPVAGAKVEVWRAGGRGTGLLDLDYKNDFQRIASMPTDRSGRFALMLPVGLPCRVVVDQAPYAIWLREDCLPGEDLTIRLEVPAVVTGTLTLADGKPATARLRAWHPKSHDEVFRGSTDAQGRYRFDRVAPGPIRLEIEPDRGPSPGWVTLNLESGRPLTHDVQLAAGARLFGRVTDEDGRPIAGARIGEGWTQLRAVTSDADGRYEMPGCGSASRPDVHCIAAGHVKQVWQRPAQLPDPCQHDFVMPRGQQATGRIVDGDGKPVADVYVQVFGTARAGQDQFFDCIATRTNRDGTFRVGGMRGDLDHALVARKDGWAMLVYALPPANADGVKHAGDVALSKPRVVRGVVTDAAGKPVANAAVNLWGYNQDRHRLDPNGNLANAKPIGNYREWGLLDMYLGSRNGRTDHLGRFAFGDVAPGTFHLVVYGENNQRIMTSEAFPVVADRDPEPIKLRTEQ